MHNPYIAFRDVSHTYRPPRGKPVLALDKVSFEVREGEFLGCSAPAAAARPPCCV